MAVAAPIIFPAVWKPRVPNTSPGLLTQLNSNTAIVKNTFVLSTSNLWVKYANAGIIVAGLMLDAGVTQANAAIAEPFNALYGPNHNPVDPRTCTFLMNTTDNSGTEGSGSTTASSITLGQYYAARYGGTTTGALMINNTTGAVTPASAGGVFWKVIAFYNTAYTNGVDGDASADFNVRVVVEIDQIGLQSIS